VLCARDEGISRSRLRVRLCARLRTCAHAYVCTRIRAHTFSSMQTCILVCIGVLVSHAVPRPSWRGGTGHVYIRRRCNQQIRVADDPVYRPRSPIAPAPSPAPAPVVPPRGALAPCGCIWRLSTGSSLTGTCKTRKAGRATTCRKNFHRRKPWPLPLSQGSVCSLPALALPPRDNLLSWTRNLKSATSAKVLG